MINFFQDDRDINDTSKARILGDIAEKIGFNDFFFDWKKWFDFDKKKRKNDPVVFKKCQNCTKTSKLLKQN